MHEIVNPISHLHASLVPRIIPEHLALRLKLRRHIILDAVLVLVVEVEEADADGVGAEALYLNLNTVPTHTIQVLAGAPSDQLVEVLYVSEENWGLDLGGRRL